MCWVFPRGRDGVVRGRGCPDVSRAPFLGGERASVVIAAFCVALSCLSRRMLRGVKLLWPRQYAFDISSELERTRGI